MSLSTVYWIPWRLCKIDTAMRRLSIDSLKLSVAYSLVVQNGVNICVTGQYLHRFLSSVTPRFLTGQDTRHLCLRCLIAQVTLCVCVCGWVGVVVVVVVAAAAAAAAAAVLV